MLLARLFLEVALGPAAFCRHAVRQRFFALPRAADDRQDDFAQAGRDAAGLEHLHAVLPNHPPGRLCLYAQPQYAAADAATAHRALDPAVRAAGDLAAVWPVQRP